MVSFKTIFKVTGATTVVIGSLIDYINVFQAQGSLAQANLNLTLGVAGIASPIYIVPASVYAVVSNNYPGGPAAYNAAYAQSVAASESGGP